MCNLLNYTLAIVVLVLVWIVCFLTCRKRLTRLFLETHLVKPIAHFSFNFAVCTQANPRLLATALRLWTANDASLDRWLTENDILIYLPVN